MLCSHPRNGLLAAGDRSYPSVAAFVAGLSDHGWTPGRNCELDAAFAEARHDRLPALARGIAQRRPDVIAAIGAVAFFALRETVPEVPVVFGIVLDAVEAGLVSRADRPGGRATGATSFDPAQAVLQVELLRRVLPGLQRLGILGDAAVPPILAQRATAAAEAVGLRPDVRLLTGPDDVPIAIESLRAEGAQALLVLEVPRTSTHASLIVARAHAAGLPTLAGRDLAKASPLLAFGTSFASATRRMASHVDRILRGARPGELPVDTVAERQLIVDEVAARQLRVDVPADVLAMARTDVGFDDAGRPPPRS